MPTYSIFILILPQIERNRNQLNIFSTKNLTILWLGMKNEFWFEKRRLHVIVNLHYVVLFLFQIHLLILLPNSCIVASRMGLVFSLRWDTHRDTHGWILSLRQELLSTIVFRESKLFSFPLHLFNKMESRRRDVDSPIWGYSTDMYLKRFLGISKYTRSFFFHINL